MKKFFHFSLFREGMRQLFLPGTILFAILLLEAILIPIQSVLTYSFTEYNGGVYSIIAQPITALEAHPFILSVPAVAAPIFSLLLFSFLNKRNSSDFYHSLPFTRGSLFFSFFMSILAWLAILAVGSGLVSVTMHLFLSKYFVFPYLSAFLMQIEALIAGALVTAAFTLAMCITGTVLNNIVIASLILFLPRLLLSLICSTVVSSLPFLPSVSYQLLNNNYNLVVSMVQFSNNIFHDDVSLSTHVFSIIYSLALTAIYVFISLVLFIRRRSEAAAASAPSKFLQAVFRIVLTLPITALICYLLFPDLMFRLNSIDWTSYVILYIVLLVVYFAYELITTRKWRNLIRAIPGVGIIVLSNLLILGTMYGIYTLEVNYIPDKDDITGISIISDSAAGYGRNISFSEYVAFFDDEIKITDPELIDMVADLLADQVNKFKENPRAYHNGFSDYINSYDCTVRIHTGVTSRMRTLSFTKNQLQQLINDLASDQSAIDYWTTVPEAKEGSFSLSSTYYTPAIPQDGLKLLYDTLVDEVKNIDFEKWFLFCNDIPSLDSYSSTYGTSSTFNNFIFTTKVDLAYYEVSIPLRADILPKTCQVFLQLVQESLEDNEDYVNLWENYTAEHSNVYYLDIDAEWTDSNNTGFELFYHYYGPSDSSENDTVHKQIISFIAKYRILDSSELPSTTFLRLRTQIDGNHIESYIPMANFDYDDIPTDLLQYITVNGFSSESIQN